jgi:hypothetical protein
MTCISFLTVVGLRDPAQREKTEKNKTGFFFRQVSKCKGWMAASIKCLQPTVLDDAVCVSLSRKRAGWSGE